MPDFDDPSYAVLLRHYEGTPCRFREQLRLLETKRRDVSEPQLSNLPIFQSTSLKVRRADGDLPFDPGCEVGEEDVVLLGTVTNAQGDLARIHLVLSHD